MPTQHIDFKHIRQNANFNLVATHYSVELKRDGSKEDQWKCICPFHDDHKPSMKINTARNIYHCFVCDAGGNILDFVMEMDGVEIRPAAKLVAEICNIDTSQTKEKSRAIKPTQKKEKPKRASIAKQASSQISKFDSPKSESDNLPVNKPLSFELKNLITDHPFISERGISEEIRLEFGIGVATRGIMKDRLVFPIHNTDGQLVAYCGRYVGNGIPENEPKYKQPSNFKKEIELFNWHRVKDMESDTPLILVESFFSVLKLHEIGFACVALMGRSLSEAQIAILTDANISEVILLLDGDDPGRDAIIKIGRDLLAANINCQAPVVPEDFNPHEVSSKELRILLI